MTAGHLRFAVDSGHGIIARPQQAGSRADIRTSIDGLVAFARAADRAGIDSFWLSEDPDGWDALQMLAVVARETGRIHVGTGVLNPHYRHPALIAASLSTLDALSDGRAFLGFGRGQTEWYERALGMDVGSPVAAMEETVGLLRQWFRRPWTASAEPGATEFPVSRWERVTGPVQECLPVYLAAVGPKAMGVAARLADGVIFNDLSSVTFMERAIREVREQAAAAGRDPGAIRFFARSAVTITDDPEAVWQQRKVTVALIHALPGMERLLETPGFDIGAIVGRVREAMDTMAVLERGGNFPELKRAGNLAEAKRHIPLDLMRELVVAGPVDEVRARLRRLREIGVTDVFLARPKGDPERIAEIVSALADA
jgi:alkanesulfonate monooxygenase SsuD/methylene tetrahydromethanopterin reductase-like flavin-dependent oxidoreductase (luciferase family)